MLRNFLNHSYFQKYSKIFENTPKCCEIFRSIPKNSSDSKIFRSFLKYSKIFGSIPRFSGIFRNISKFSSRNIPKHLEKFQKIPQKFSKIKKNCNISKNFVILYKVKYL